MIDDNGDRDRAKAAALAYTENDRAPRVVAQGYGDVAEQIIAEARRAGIFVYESRELVALLMQLDLDEQIPPQMYTSIAELLAWVAQISSSQPD